MQNTPTNNGMMDSHMDETAGEGCAMDLLMLLLVLLMDTSVMNALTIMPVIRKLTPATNPSTSNVLDLIIRLCTSSNSRRRHTSELVYDSIGQAYILTLSQSLEEDTKQ